MRQHQFLSLANVIVAPALFLSAWGNVGASEVKRADDSLRNDLALIVQDRTDVQGEQERTYFLSQIVKGKEQNRETLLQDKPAFLVPLVDCLPNETRKALFIKPNNRSTSDSGDLVVVQNGVAKSLTHGERTYHAIWGDKDTALLCVGYDRQANDPYQGVALSLISASSGEVFTLTKSFFFAGWSLDKKSVVYSRLFLAGKEIKPDTLFNPARVEGVETRYYVVHRNQNGKPATPFAVGAGDAKRLLGTSYIYAANLYVAMMRDIPQVRMVGSPIAVSPDGKRAFFWGKTRYNDKSLTYTHTDAPPPSATTDCYVVSGERIQRRGVAPTAFVRARTKWSRDGKKILSFDLNRQDITVLDAAIGRVSNLRITKRDDEKVVDFR